LSGTFGDTITTSKQVELDEYVVTANRTPRALKDVPVLTRVITSADIQRMAPQNIMDMLQSELPGLEITRTEGVANSITYQGLGANYLLILVDGERLAGETSRSNPDFNRIDIDNIERIEVVKGAMSALYGSGAVGAVINIITKRPSEGFEAQLQGHYDSEGEERARLNIGFRRPQWESVTNVLGRLKQSYMAHGIEPLRLLEGQENTLADETPVSMEIEGYRNLLIEQQFRYRPVDGLNIGLKGGYYAHERYNAGIVGELKHDIYRDYNAALKFDYRIPGWGSLLFTYKYDGYNKYDYFRKLKQTERNYQNVLHCMNLTFAVDEWHNQELVCGLEFIGERLQTYQFEGNRHQATQLAMYIQDDWKISPTVSMQGGIRGDYHSVTSDFSVTPKLSVMWHYEGWNFRCGYAMGFRSPTLKELYTVWDHQGLFELIGNASLKSEKKRQSVGFGRIFTRYV
jgi:Outer membrane receptor for ferrienterochelin and colicins